MCAAAALVAASCATAGPGEADDGDDDDDVVADVDASPRTPDAAPGQPDAPVVPAIDAAPDTPDAPVVPPIDAAPGTPDAAPMIDASPGTCTANFSIACGGSVAHSLLGADDSISGYSCGSLDTTLEDNIYSFVAPTSGTVNINLDVAVDDLFGDDMDLYVLGGVCGPASCITSGTAVGDENVSFTATAGTTYYFVVELYSLGFATFEDYTLTVGCP